MEKGLDEKVSREPGVGGACRQTTAADINRPNGVDNA
jgi:hypothetical protein